ncbi:hypothetical protein E2C01_099429 [Portunus trituberculatus]|uniref:Uncharacterized protein n=1 Tax=Portunus trituberculatus TaxID=210409 RepID=A0A5B7KGU3_PORTR|nr:hypothetical protein [Portunus trituberculatus]
MISLKHQQDTGTTLLSCCVRDIVIHPVLLRNTAPTTITTRDHNKTSHEGSSTQDQGVAWAGLPGVPL